MRISHIGQLPNFFDRYIQLVEDIDLLDALQFHRTLFTDLELDVVNEIGDRVYAESKWTIKEIVQHLIDNERIQSYRALRFSRGDKTLLPGYDENIIASTSNANARSLDALLQEFEVVRRSSLLLFSSMTDYQMVTKGNASGIDISPLSLGFQIIGHQIHHLKVIKERYFPIIELK